MSYKDAIASPYGSPFYFGSPPNFHLLQEIDLFKGGSVKRNQVPLCGIDFTIQRPNFPGIYSYIF